MGEIAYSVSARLPTEALREEYVAWLKAGHLDEVCGRGATEGRVIVVLDPPIPIIVRTEYRFPSREALDAYLWNHAPRLRAEGLARFGPERGVSFERQIGLFV